MGDEKLTDQEVDKLLRAASYDQPQPDAAWLARVAKDASDVTARRARHQMPGLWMQVTRALGGWQGLGGMAVACGAGLWIGIMPPAVLGDPFAAVLDINSATVELITETAFDDSQFLEEG